MGMRMRVSQFSLVSRRIPSPSAPRTMAREPVRSHSNRSQSDSSAVPTMRIPHSLRMRSRKRAMFATETTGTYIAPPQETRTAVSVTGEALWRGTMTARTPAPSAERRQAPRLCGSCTPSRTRRRTSSSCAMRSKRSSSVSRAMPVDELECTLARASRGRLPGVLGRRCRDMEDYHQAKISGCPSRS